MRVTVPAAVPPLLLLGVPGVPAVSAPAVEPLLGLLLLLMVRRGRVRRTDVAPPPKVRVVRLLLRVADHRPDPASAPATIAATATARLLFVVRPRLALSRRLVRPSAGSGAVVAPPVGRAGVAPLLRERRVARVEGRGAVLCGGRRRGGRRADHDLVPPVVGLAGPPASSSAGVASEYPRPGLLVRLLPILDLLPRLLLPLALGLVPGPAAGRRVPLHYDHLLLGLFGRRRSRGRLVRPERGAPHLVGDLRRAVVELAVASSAAVVLISAAVPSVAGVAPPVLEVAVGPRVSVVSQQAQVDVDDEVPWHARPVRLHEPY